MDVAILQALISGLAVGSAYALVALGFSVTFTTTRTLNFSHGEFVSAGAFIGMSALFLDTPGIGEALRYQKLTTRPDYEKPIGAAIDLGKTAEAQATFAKVSGLRAPIAALWSAYAKSKAAAPAQ